MEELLPCPISRLVFPFRFHGLVNPPQEPSAPIPASGPSPDGVAGQCNGRFFDLDKMGHVRALSMHILRVDP